MKSSPSIPLSRVWLRYGIYAILLLAFAIQIYRLDARTWHGDELGSVLEATQLGRNANSLPYFVFLNLWLGFGGGEFWLRSLSALLAVMAVAITYAWAKRLAGGTVACTTGLLLATSPFLLVYGQQVRFYTFALLAASLSVWMFIVYLQRPSLRPFTSWSIASLFAVAALVLNCLLVLGQMVTGFVSSQQLSRKSKIVLLGGVIVLGVTFLLAPDVRALGFNALATYTNADSRYFVSRGLTLAQVAKIPFTFFFFTFGESVYPLTYWLVIPGAILFGVALIFGLLKLWHNRRAFIFVVVTGITALGLLYLVFDPLAPPTLQGAAPRYLIFLLPLFYLVIAVSTQGKRLSWPVIPLVLVNLASLTSYWYGDWSYTDDRVNWRAVTQWISNYASPQAMLLMDGRSQGMGDYYFPATWNRQNQSAYSQVMDSSQIVFLSYDFHSERRIQSTALLRRIENDYDQSAVWSQYPLFVYVYDRKPTPSNAYRVDPTTGRVNLPAEIYGLEFQDLRLPMDVLLNGSPLQITGAFGLPTLTKQSNQMIPLNPPTTARKIVLLSNLTDAGALLTGAQVATLQVQSADGAVQIFPLRAGYETSAWDKSCLPAACKPIHTWRKRLALLGSQAYPGSWQEFAASIFAAELALNQPTLIRTLELERTASPGTLYVWGLVLEK